MTDGLDAIEEAIAALGRGDPDGARAAIVRAASTDRSVGPVADAVVLACAEIEGRGGVSSATWNALADACPPEILPTVEAWRR